ncbi:unnamed protein product, partial [Brenthis ino]
MFCGILKRSAQISAHLIKNRGREIINSSVKNVNSFSLGDHHTRQSYIFQRFYSKQPSVEELTVDYEYVNKAANNKKTIIVDVREPEEIKEHGKIPNSINIPLGNVSTVLGTMTEKEFQTLYKLPKPSEETEIIFYCMIGRRSGMAQQNAINLGFKNVKNYLGSWTDWASKTQ